jgi:preprotein translocase subunit SecG
MTLLFIILIIVACIVLSLIVLVQNPKGGGLAGNIAGISNQFMGVKQTNDILEKGTWIFAAIIGILCILSTIFISGGSTIEQDRIQSVSTGPIPTTQQPAQTQPNTAPLNQQNNQQPPQNQQQPNR